MNIISAFKKTVWALSLLVSFDQQVRADSACQPKDLTTQDMVGEPRDDRWLVVSQARARLLERDKGAILILGDSLAGRWPAALQQELFDHRFINLGIGGDRVENVQWRLKFYDLAKAEPRAVVMILGTNNLRTEDTPEKIFARLSAVICEVKAQIGKTELIVSEILPRGQDLSFKATEISTINGFLGSAQASLGFQLLRVHDAIVASCGGQYPCPLFVDGVHLNDAGYRVFSGLLQNSLAMKR